MKKLTLPKKVQALKLAEEKALILAKRDPVAFAKYYLDFTPDPWQVRFLQSKSDRIILNCSRQSGKSTSTAILALWEALHKPNSVIVIESPSFRQSIELTVKFSEYMRLLGENVELISDTKLSIQFKNGSRVLALPGSEKTIRGISAVSLLIIDEAARVSDVLYKSLRPMLAVSHGRLILLSTPYGRQGFFYEVWEKGEEWEKIQVKATECPRITPEFLAEEKMSMGELWWRQEYFADFTALADARIKREWLQYEDHAPEGLKIMMGVDLAISLKETSDYTACVVLGRDKKGLLHVLDAQRIRASFQQQIEFIKQIADKWQPSVVAVEDVAYQRAMIQTLNAQTSLNILPVRPDKDKISRFAPLEARYEQKQVWHLRDLPVAFEPELLSFPVAEHDDFIDGFSAAWAAFGAEVIPTVLTFSTQPMARPYSIGTY